ncbi:MAG: plastocyanin/azurin family copper-binding protein [Candidatus Baltobacteraceae bacterium]
MNIRNTVRFMALASLFACLPFTAGAKPHVQRSPAHPALVIIRIDLDFRPHTRSSFGKLKGYDPAEVHVHMGDKIQFVNTDDELHTATGMSYSGQTAPANYKFAGDFTKQHGRIIDASEWSTGNVRAHGGKSQVFIAKRVGHYFYACGYHLGVGQIGVIVVGP